MLVGITFDLRSEYLAAGFGEEETAEFDRAETIQAIQDALAELGYVPDRIGHARQLTQRLVDGCRWDLVFNICEGMWGAGREAQVPAILDLYQIPYTFADPLVMSLCLHKGLAKTVVQHAGVPTTHFRVIEQVRDLARVDLRFPLFLKPVAEGTGKGITPASRVRTPEAMEEVCGRLLDRFRQPVLVEEFLPGREFTVGLLGTGRDARVLGTLEIVLRPEAEPDVYSYSNKENSEELIEYRLVRPEADREVAQAEQIALAAWRALGCRDAGRVDLRSDRFEHPQFLEANPLAGLHPSHSDLPMLATALGIPYVELIGLIVASAAKRKGNHQPAICP